MFDSVRKKSGKDGKDGLKDKGYTRTKSGSIRNPVTGLFGSKGTTASDEWIPLLEAYDGVAGLAEALHVGTATINRWTTQGVRPRDSMVTFVGIVAASKGLPNPFDVKKR